jgi:hypothetical protein
MLGFLIGAVAGAVAATYWRADAKERGMEQVTRLRHQAAEKLEAGERAVVQALDNASTRAVSYLRGVEAPAAAKTAGQRPGE